MKKFTFLFFVLTTFISANGLNVEEYQFISPKPGSTDNTRESTIIIREGANIDLSSIGKPGLIKVTGSLSGNIDGEVILSRDGKTLIFKPYSKFQPNEDVKVQMGHGLQSIDGKVLPSLAFSFKITHFTEMPNPTTTLPELKDKYLGRKSKRANNITLNPTGEIPEVEVVMNDSTQLGEGKIFLAVAADVEDIGYYLMILNNDGSLYYAKELEDDYAYDFKVQPNGYITYAHFLEHHSFVGGGNVIHMAMDNSMTVVDSFQAGNGYIAEAHDFQMLPNGHALLFGYYFIQVNMALLYDGAYPNALVAGGVVQELDQDKNVVFQWRSWDHYDPYNFSHDNRTRLQAIVNAFHLNTISLDADQNILISTPSWGKKINRQTGEIMYHLGGDENEFSFVGVDSTDGVGHLGGHTLYRIPNGNLTVYDNGTRQGTRSSMVHEYSIDEVNKIATHVWTWEPDTIIAGWHRGSAQRLPNGNTVIGWGGTTSSRHIPAFTEVNPNGDVLMEISFSNYAVESYRAFRFPVPTNDPAAEVTQFEVVSGNTYEFEEGDDETGVRVTITALAGSGYNEFTVKRFNYSPVNPLFFGKAPRVLPMKIQTVTSGISSVSYQIKFDADFYGIDNPGAYKVYHREFPGNGLFLELPTSYNSIDNEIIGEADAKGEFILAYPDLASIAIEPLLFSPVDSCNVSQEDPVTLQWTPQGYVTSYRLQVSTDENFGTTVIDESQLTETLFTTDILGDNSTYYWRVNVSNDVGTSDWSEVYMFTTSPSYVQLTSHNGGEEYQVNEDYFITWDDNIVSDVDLHLSPAGMNEWEYLGSWESTGGFKWSVPVSHELGMYEVRIRSREDTTIFDISDAPFAIMDSTVSVNDEDILITDYELHQNYPNPFNPATRIDYDLPRASNVTIAVFDLLGREITTLVNEYKPQGRHAVVFDASNISSGIYIYKIKADDFSKSRKMLLLK